jgi:hypothetical protein
MAARAVLLFGLMGGVVAAAFAADSPAAIVGTWEGDSKCTVPNSPCHDEHVVYEIKADSKLADHFTIDAYKIVSGERGFMGTLDCYYPAQPGILRCIGRRQEDVWLFHVAGDTMTGTLTIGVEKQLFRKVQVRRPQSH